MFSPENYTDPRLHLAPERDGFKPVSMDQQTTLTIAIPLIMLLGQLLINRETRRANHKLQKELERLRQDNDQDAREEQRRHDAQLREQEEERQNTFYLRKRADLEEMASRLDHSLDNLDTALRQIGHRVAK